MNIRRSDSISSCDILSSQDSSPISSSGKKKPTTSRRDSVGSIAETDRESPDSITSFDSAKSLDSIVPCTLDFHEEDDNTSAKQLADLKKKYSVTKGLLDNSLAAYPEIKSSLTLEDFSYDNIRKLLLYSSHRENSAEALQDRKALKEESLSFIHDLKKKLDALEIEIENLEPEDWGDTWREVSEEDAKQRYGTKISEK